MSWKNGKWLVLDTETTGLNVSDGARVWEVGWAEVDKLELGASGRWIIDPGIPVPDIVQKLTRMDPKELEGQPSFADIADKLISKMEVADLVIAYNSPFDRGMLDNEFGLVGKRMPEKLWLDPLVWVRRIKGLGNYKLATMAQHFKVELVGAHRAETDAVATAKIAIEFIKKSPINEIMPDDLSTMANSQNTWRAEHNAERDERRASARGQHVVLPPAHDKKV